MVEGVRLDTEQLIRAYGVTRRLAVRLGALRARGLVVSPTLLEIAGPGSRVEALLLHPALLDRAETLNTAQAMDIAREVRADEEGPLVVVEQGGERILALEEEILAEKASPAQPRTLVRPESPLAVSRVLDRREMEHLFTPEEIARLKLEAIAGGDESSRISALRKLRYAPLGAREKGGIYLRVLIESSGSVRSEAVRELEALGFNRDTADALQRVFEGPPERRASAIRRIADLLGRLQQGEREIVLVVLMEIFRDSPPSGEDDPMLAALIEAAPLLSGQRDLVGELVRICVRHLLDAPFSRPRVVALAKLILKLADADREAVLARLWEEAETVRDPAPRAEILRLLVDIETDRTRRGRLAERILDEVTCGEHDELARQTLGHQLLALGADAADAMRRRYAEATGDQRIRLIAFLDMMCLDASLEARLRLALVRQLLGSLKVADRRVRMEILRTRILNQGDLPPHMRRLLARELLALLRTADSADVSDRAAALLENLGGAAVPPIYRALVARPRAREADAMARVLARILVGIQPQDPSAGYIEKACHLAARMIKRRESEVGGYAYALGLLASSALCSPEVARQAFDLLASRLGQVRWAADAVEGLSRLAATDRVTAEQRVQAVHLLSELVDRPAEEEETLIREVQTEKGRIYAITGRVEFDSEILPAAVAGLASIATAPATPEGLRGQIVQMFLRIWPEVAAWKRVWGPRSADALAQALARLGSDERTDDALRSRIVDALAGGKERLAVVRALERLFSVPSASTRFNERVVRAAAEILEHWIEPEIAPEQLEAVLRAAARAVARPDVNWRSARARNLRQRTVDLLFETLAKGLAWPREPLSWIRDNPSTPRSLREDIANRLRDAPA